VALNRDIVVVMRVNGDGSEDSKIKLPLIMIGMFIDLWSESIY